MKLSIHGVELDESTPPINLPRRPVLTRITKNLCTADHTQAEPHLEGVGEVLEELAAGHSVIFTAKMRATDLLFLMQVLKESKPFAKYNVTFGTGSIEDPLRNVVLSKDRKTLYYRVIPSDMFHQTPTNERPLYYVDGTSPKEVFGAYRDVEGSADTGPEFVGVCFTRLTGLKRPFHFSGALKRYVPGMKQG